MKVNILRYSLFGIAGGQEVDHAFVKFIIYPFTMIALYNLFGICKNSREFETKVTGTNTKLQNSS